MFYAVKVNGIEYQYELQDRKKRYPKKGEKPMMWLDCPAAHVCQEFQAQDIAQVIRDLPSMIAERLPRNQTSVQ